MHAARLNQSNPLTLVWLRPYIIIYFQSCLYQMNSLVSEVIKIACGTYSVYKGC